MRPDVRADLETVIEQSYQRLGRYGEAESLHRDALEIVRANNPTPNERVAGVLSDLVGGRGRDAV